jgi:Asp/Glu/hydantoin racemase
MRPAGLAQLAQRMASAVDLPVVHGMQEVSGSSLLSSTPDQMDNFEH